MKKLISIILTCIILLGATSLSCLSVGAIDSYVCGDYTYQLKNSQAVVTKYNGNASEVEIPTSLDGYAVVELMQTFSGNNTVQKVVIPQTVTTIGLQSFNFCGVKKIIIKSKSVAIGDYAFNSCINLTNIEFPKDGTITTIGASAFANCYELEEINLVGNPTSIGDKAFHNCTKLKEIILPDSLINIGREVFLRCTALKSVKLPNNDNFKKIPYGMFNSCTSLPSVEIPDSVSTIDFSAFKDCDSFTSVALPSSITTISNAAFSNCSSLTTVDLSKTKITTISPYLFQSCEKLTTVTLPETGLLTTIDMYAFENCSALKFSKNTSTPFYIPDTVTKIGTKAFQYCKSLESFDIPKGVKQIDMYTFKECSNLTKISIPNSITSIKSYAFENTALVDITLPESLTEINNTVLTVDSLEKVTFLNPDCIIYDSPYTIYENAVIYGYEESTAQAYAEKYNRKFVALNETPEYMLGDVNGDKVINILDTTMVQRAIAKQITLTDIQTKAADTDKNGKIVVMDATAIQRYIAKIITEF